MVDGCYDLLLVLSRAVEPSTGIEDPGSGGEAASRIDRGVPPPPRRLPGPGRRRRGPEERARAGDEVSAGHGAGSLADRPGARGEPAMGRGHPRAGDRIAARARPGLGQAPAGHLRVQRPAPKARRGAEPPQRLHRQPLRPGGAVPAAGLRPRRAGVPGALPDRPRAVPPRRSRSGARPRRPSRRPRPTTGPRSIATRATTCATCSWSTGAACCSGPAGSMTRSPTWKRPSG